MIHENDIERVKNAAQSMPIDNETTEWDCQDYVLEILKYWTNWRMTMFWLKMTSTLTRERY